MPLDDAPGGSVLNQATLPERGAELSSSFSEMARAFVTVLAGVGSIVVQWAWSELVLRAGWLPHRSIPPELIVEATDVEDADRRLAQFFRGNWSRIGEDFRQSVAASSVDRDAKDAFNECLAAHEAGLFRVAPALLFPHIERVVRSVLMPGALGAFSANELCQAVGELGPSQFVTPGVNGVRLYSKLANHLYAQVRTPDEVLAARADPVPNRHAVLHGRVSYASEKSSLNMLIMADFIFDALTKVEAQRREAAAAINGNSAP